VENDFGAALRLTAGETQSLLIGSLAAVAVIVVFVFAPMHR
jgi:hypothetical protein